MREYCIHRTSALDEVRCNVRRPHRRRTLSPRHRTGREMIAARSVRRAIRWGACSGGGWIGKPYPKFRTVNILRRKMRESGGRLDLRAGNSVRIEAIVHAFALVAWTAILGARAATSGSVMTDNTSHAASDPR